MMQWRDSLAGVLGGLADVLAKRSAEKERSTLRTCQAWQQAATTLALALMSGSGISICKCPPHMASCNCERPAPITFQVKEGMRADAVGASPEDCVRNFALMLGSRPTACLHSSWQALA